MAVSVTLTGGGSIIAWQTPTGISFQRFNADHQTVGSVTSIATGPTAWLERASAGEWRVLDHLGHERDLDTDRAEL